MMNTEIAAEMQSALVAVGWTVGPLSYSDDGSVSFTVFAGSAMRGTRAVKPHTRTFLPDCTMVVSQI